MPAVAILETPCACFAARSDTQAWILANAMIELRSAFRIHTVHSGFRAAMLQSPWKEALCCRKNPTAIESQCQHSNTCQDTDSRAPSLELGRVRKMTKRHIMPAMASSRPESEPLNIQLLVDSIPALIHTSRPDGYLDYFNKPWLEYLGATLDKVAGWNWTTFIHPEDVDGIVAKWRACLASGEVFEYETRVRRADGEYRWMFHRKVPLRDERGNIVKWYGSSLDIEERKTAEEQLRRNTEALQRSEFYLAEGQRLGHMGSWAFDPDGFDYWSPELFRMHGLDPAGKAPSVQEYLRLIHPQDRESMADLINRLAAEDSPFDATKRIVRPDGEVRYIRCVGVPVVDNQSLKKYVGSAIDVTEHELLTQELRRREAYSGRSTEAQPHGQLGLEHAHRHSALVGRDFSHLRL